MLWTMPMSAWHSPESVARVWSTPACSPPLPSLPGKPPTSFLSSTRVHSSAHRLQRHRQAQPDAAGPLRHSIPPPPVPAATAPLPVARCAFTGLQWLCPCCPSSDAPPEGHSRPWRHLTGAATVGSLPSRYKRAPPAPLNPAPAPRASSLPP